MWSRIILHIKRWNYLAKSLNEYARIVLEYSSKGKVQVGFLSKIYSCQFAGNNKVGDFSHISRSSFGIHSYCAKNCQIFNSEIGEYCSIGPNVLIGYGNHPTDRESSHPYFYSSRYNPELKESTFVEDAPVKIGNHVWIGANAIIANGVTIGDHVTIAAGSFVNKDWGDGVIIGGVPAKILK
jgi:acetyltransferase-like isoleucine patch superfamily enzyme